MFNKLKKTNKQPGKASKFFSSVALTGSLLLFVLKPGISKANTELRAELMKTLKEVPVQEWKIVEADESTEKIAKFEMVNDTTDALTFAVSNVDKYYPDMKQHLDTMINSFRDEEHRSATIKLLNEMTENITDPAQKTGAIIYALEGVFRKNQSFSLKYDEEINDETFDFIIIFDNSYKARFKEYYERLEKQTKRLQEEIIRKQELIKQKDEEIKQSEENLKQSEENLKQSQEELKKSLQELEATLSKFSPDDVKNNP